MNRVLCFFMVLPPNFTLVTGKLLLWLRLTHEVGAAPGGESLCLFQNLNVRFATKASKRPGNTSGLLAWPCCDILDL